jgi:hypothetical protein
MAEIIVQNVNAPAITFVAATSTGDTFYNGSGSEMLVIRNNNIADRTITFHSPGTCNFGLSANPAHDLAIVVPGDGGGTGSYIFKRIDALRFNDVNGMVSMTYSNNGNGLTIAVIA